MTARIFSDNLMEEVRLMGMAMAGDAVSAQHADIMLKVGFALQKKTMDLAELQGQMLQELMASMGVGKNLDIQA